MISKVIQWSNGMVTVFDESGEQISDLQGRRNAVAKTIGLQDLSEATFEIGSWGVGIVPMTKEQFFSEAWE